MGLNRRVFFIGLCLAATLAACHGSGGVTPPGPGPRSSSSAAPTSSGSASPSPKPTSSPQLAAYCNNVHYSAAPGGVPLNITDDSGLGATLVVYVEQGGTAWLGTNGSFTASVPNPLPAACFANTVGAVGTSKQLVIPANTNGGRIYFAYAPSPNPASTTVPDPFGASVTTGGPPYGYGNASYPWDVVEFGDAPGATIDTTQVNGIGLPLEITVGSTPLPSGGGACAQPPAPPSSGSRTSGIVGVTSCDFANIFTALATNAAYAAYKPLVVTQPFNGKIIDMQVVSPQDAFSDTSFQWDMLGLESTLPSPVPNICPAGSRTYGYLTCLLNAYHTPLSGARLFQTSSLGINGVTGDNYCATSDGSSNFTFTDVGNAASCASATPNPSAPSPNPFQMPVQEFTYGIQPGAAACKLDLLFSQPWGTAYVGNGNLFATMDAFAMWKALTSDINRGTMLTTSRVHPVGVTSPVMGDFFTDPMYNQYAQVVHTYFDNNLAYALAYDDLGTPNFASALVMPPSPVAIDVRINAVPAASSVMPASPPIPVPSPAPACSALPPNVGSF